MRANNESSDYSTKQGKLKKKKYATIHCNETAEDQRQGKDLKNKEKIQRNYNLTDSRLLNSDRS